MGRGKGGRVKGKGGKGMLREKKREESMGRVKGKGEGLGVVGKS